MRWAWQMRKGMLIIAVDIVILLWLMQYIYRELLPVSSAFLMQEAYIAADTIEPAGNRAIAMAHIARALVHAGNLQEARRFITDSPLAVQLFASYEVGHALIDQGQLDDALDIARHIHRQYGFYNAHLNISGFRVPDGMPNSSLLFQRLARVLIAANRLRDAYEVTQMLQADAEAKDARVDLLCTIVHQAAERAQIKVAATAIEVLPKEKWHEVPWQRLIRLAMEQGDWRRAAQWLQRYYESASLLYTPRSIEKLFAPLPSTLIARVRQVEALARRGQTTRALTLAEQTLLDYLNRHNERTIDYELLTHLTARLTTLLPFSQAHRMLLRLPTRRYECAETHIDIGFLCGLALSGRERALEEILPTFADRYVVDEVYRLLSLTAAEQRRISQAERWLRSIQSPTLKELVIAEIALRYARAGRIQEAHELLRAVPFRDEAQDLRNMLEFLRQPPNSMPPEVVHAIYTILRYDEVALQILEPLRFASPTPVSRRSLLHELEAILSDASYRILRLRDARLYPELLLVLRYWQSINNSEFSIEIEYSLQEIAGFAIYHQFYDLLLGEVALAYEEDDDWLGYARQKYLMQAAAAAAQVGQLQEAERLRRAAGRVDWYLNTLYEVGYAIGLAKRGEYRTAARWARRVKDPSWRVYALAEVAAEMRKQGR